MNKNTNNKSNSKGNANTKKVEKEVSNMSKKQPNEMKVGDKFLMKVKGEISEYEVIAMDAKTVTLRDEDGNERKHIYSIAKSSFNKQVELRAELDEMEDESDDEEVEDEDLDEVEDDDSDEDDDDEDGELDDESDDEEDEEDPDMPPEDDDEDEEEEEHAPKKNKGDASKKDSGKSKPKKETKSSAKYWENEDPLVSEMENNEIRFYEEAGKFQIFNKIENKKAGDGSMMITKGITIDVNDMSSKEAMKFIANIVYAMKGAMEGVDERFEEVVGVLEDINEGINPEDYVFSKKELEAMDLDKLIKVANNLGITKFNPNNKREAIMSKIMKIQKEKAEEE